VDVLEGQEYGLRPRDERDALRERVKQPASILPPFWWRSHCVKR